MLVGLPIDWRLAMIAIACLGIAGSALIAIARTGTLLDAAREVDTALGLNDRISSALEFAHNESSDAFVGLATIEGERAATGASLKEAIVFRLGNTWAAWPVLAALAIALGVYAPRYDLLGAEAQELVAFERETDHERAEEQLREIREELEQGLAADALPAEDFASEEALRTLDTLERELAERTDDPDAVREKAAGALNEAALEYEDRAERAEIKRHATEEILSELAREPGGEPGDGELAETPESASQETDAFDPVDALRDSLSESELEEAAKALDEIQKALEQLTPEQREALERELEALAQELREAGERAEQDVELERELEREELGDWGVDEPDAEQMQGERTEEEIREELEKLGFDEDKARRMAKNIAKKERERRAREEAANETKELAEEIDRAADDPNDDPAEPEAPEQPHNEPGPNEDSQDPSAEPNDQQSEQQQQQQQQQQQSEEPGEQEDGTEREGAESQQGEPSERSEQPQGSDPQGEQGTEQQQGGEPSEQGGEGQSQGDPAKPGEESRPGATQEQGGEEGDETRQAPGGDGTAEPGERHIDRLRERLDDMQKSAEDADRLRGKAGKLREQAEKLLEGMSPRERERLADWMRTQQAERGGDGPFETEDVDARAESESRRVAAETTNPDWEADRTEGSVSERALTDQLREAARGNERALEERSVPSKYRNVEEYFRRAIERAEKQANEKAPAPAGTPAEQAQDAKPEGKKKD